MRAKAHNAREPLEAIRSRAFGGVVQWSMRIVIQRVLWSLEKEFNSTYLLLSKLRTARM